MEIVGKSWMLGTESLILEGNSERRAWTRGWLVERKSNPRMGQLTAVSRKLWDKLWEPKLRGTIWDAMAICPHHPGTRWGGGVAWQHTASRAHVNQERGAI